MMVSVLPFLVLLCLAFVMGALFGIGLMALAVEPAVSAAIGEGDE